VKKYTWRTYFIAYSSTNTSLHVCIEVFSEEIHLEDVFYCVLEYKYLSTCRGAQRRNTPGGLILLRTKSTIHSK
jgi:hypothetical protein